MGYQVSDSVSLPVIICIFHRTYHALKVPSSNLQTPLKQSPMLSSYLQNPATVLERLTNHIPAESVVEKIKETEQVLRDLDPALTLDGENRNLRNGSAG